MDAGVENTGADTMLSLDERLVDDHTAPEKNKLLRLILLILLIILILLILLMTGRILLMLGVQKGVK